MPSKDSSLYRPPAPVPLSPLVSLMRVIRRGDGNLLELVPRDAYSRQITPLGYSRRSIVLINSIEDIRNIVTDPLGIFPKNDLMTGALRPLVGDSIFVSDGDTWRRQRRMVDPAFTHMRINAAFPAMEAAVEACVDRLDQMADGQQTFSLDILMSHLTADVICRTIFSKSLESETAHDVFDAFTEFERSVASVDLKQLIFGKPWADVKQPASVLAACERIRQHINDLLAPRLAADAPVIDDIVGSMIAARDPETGQGFTREELIDQIGVFFLAGHETTASVLTWIVFILARHPETAARMRSEVKQVCGEQPIAFSHLKQLRFIQSVFRETLRLYPPITFIPRVAAQETVIGGKRIKKGAMVMLSPWATHRNENVWNNADRFDPDRFMRDGENADKPETFLSFGYGPRICVGAAFATIESTLILARLVSRYDFTVLQPETVRPVARLTTRPATEIMCKVAWLTEART